MLILNYMQPTVTQLNNRNTAVGAPATATGIYTPTDSSNGVGTYSAPGVKNMPPAEQTTISSGNINDKVIPQDQSRLASLGMKGPVVGGDGVTRLADGSVDMDAMRSAGGFYQGEDGNKYYNYDSTPFKDSSAFTADEQQTFNDLKKNLDANTKQSLDVAHQTYDMAKAKQDEINQNTQNAEGASLLSSNTTRYAPKDSATYLASLTKEGLAKVNQLNIDEDRLIAQANAAQANGDKDILNSKLNLIEKVRTEKQARIDKLTDQTNAHMEDLQTQQEQATKDKAVADEISKGVTDPNEILKNLQASGNTTISAKDIAATIANMHPDAALVHNTMAEAAKNGAPQDVLAQIGKATNLTDAIIAAGQYTQDPTSAAGQYNAYIKSAQASGKTPVDYQTYAATQKYLDSYNSAKGTAAGKAAVDMANGVNPDGTPIAPKEAIDKDSQSILSQTGLSLTAFNYLTQGTASLSRLSASQRNSIMNEAENFLNSKGLDVSTFQSQYKAYNEVLQKNLERSNNTRVYAGEVSGSADALIKAIDEKDMGNIKAANVLNLMLGKEVNDPTTQKYSFQLQAMANDLAGYFAASRGASSPELQDQKDAANLIGNGMSKRSVQAFKDSINSNEEKVNKVVGNAVQSTQKQVWNLFGVADKFNPADSQDTSSFINYSEDEAKNAIVSAIKQNINKQDGTPLTKEDVNKVTAAINPKTGQPYTYLDAVQAYGLDIPSIGGGDTTASSGGPSIGGLLKYMVGLPQ